MAGVSLKCGDCGTLLRSVKEAQEHAELTKHSNFFESIEPVLNLLCSSCLKPCRSKTESDLHTKRTGHHEFVDRTLETVKPISLDVQKGCKGDVEMEESSSSNKHEGSVLCVIDCALCVVFDIVKWLFQKLLEELEGMGFPKARATRALHYSGNVGLEDAVNWAVEHENDADIDQMLKAPLNTKTEAPKPSLTPEETKMKAQELKEQARKKKEEEEKRMEREREKNCLHKEPAGRGTPVRCATWANGVKKRTSAPRTHQYRLAVLHVLVGGQNLYTRKVVRGKHCHLSREGQQRWCAHDLGAAWLA
ncbi:hypothetical protein HYC85_024892 [Camellia sinensis]|uniref:UBA domain-containing protein n=1 Tax=Camellia sinensis TaxID=4442 RepID=A0A7J7GDK0_CAMSI|nr:hypothetical protein HYC85_024892 [Camellia sinensis]